MTLKIAVVGTGRVAQTNYLPFLAKQEDVKLSYFNRTPEKAEECARRFGGQAAGSIAELMADAPDAVLVLTRETERYAAALSVLEHAPKRIFFEKPLVAMNGQQDVSEDDFDKGREIMQRARAAATETAMVFNYRFFDQTQKARQIVTERNFGALVQATGFVHYACWSHCIDLIQLFAGPVAEVTALAGAVDHTAALFTARDVTAAFVTAGGATGTILGSAAPSFAFPLFELLFSFERGRLTMRGLDGDLEVLDYQTNHHELFGLTRGTSQWDQYNRSFEKATGAYLDSIRSGGAPPVPGIAGLQELQFEAALKRSIRLRRPVALDDELPLE